MPINVGLRATRPTGFYICFYEERDSFVFVDLVCTPHQDGGSEGNKKHFNIEYLRKIADVLEVDVCEFFKLP